MIATITEKFQWMYSLEYSDWNQNVVAISDNIPFLLAIVKDKVNSLTIKYDAKIQRVYTSRERWDTTTV